MVTTSQLAIATSWRSHRCLPAQVNHVPGPQPGVGPLKVARVVGQQPSDSGAGNVWLRLAVRQVFEVREQQPPARRVADVLRARAALDRLTWKASNRPETGSMGS